MILPQQFLSNQPSMHSFDAKDRLKITPDELKQSNAPSERPILTVTFVLNHQQQESQPPRQQQRNNNNRSKKKNTNKHNETVDNWISILGVRYYLNRKYIESSEMSHVLPPLQSIPSVIVIQIKMNIVTVNDVPIRLPFLFDASEDVEIKLQGPLKGVYNVVWSQYESEEKRNFLGQQLFPLIEGMEPYYCPKITGMCLELDDEEVVRLINHAEYRSQRVNEAISVLMDYFKIQDN
jgi:hypothetical protein